MRRRRSGFSGVSTGLRHLTGLWAGIVLFTAMAGAPLLGQTWTWRSGGSEVAEKNSFGVYGTKGVASSSSFPGAREFAASCVDSSGNLWLFGGQGYSAGGSWGSLNDLWRWDGTNWTWMSGSSDAAQYGSYGAKGVASAANIPGARNGALCGIDSSGKVWLFGGYGYTSASSGFLNDLWKWDGTNWAWVSGSNESAQPGTYGTKGVASSSNVPGARDFSASWTDSSGNLWLFGGQGYGASTSGALNDLWKWDGTNWTWIGGSSSPDQLGIYGTKGVAAASNQPGGRYDAVAVRSPSGTVSLFGGYGFLASGGGGYLNDLWRWDGTNWTWMSGASDASYFGNYGTKGMASSSNAPGARLGSVLWRDSSGALWLFGGYGLASSSYGRLNDLWKWDGTNWTWMGGSSDGDHAGTYGTKGVSSSSNTPGAREFASAGLDLSGNLWLFGGWGYASDGGAYLDDLWKWDGTNWTWVNGSANPRRFGSYGTKGNASSSNLPGARYGASTWTDLSGGLWLFGGNGAAAASTGTLNDLWKWDGTVWTWMSGSNGSNQTGNYGTKGAAASTNVPGGRSYASSWTDSSGNLWLFGGWGFGSDSTWGYLNDLWKWDGSNWTWVSGSSGIDQSGSFGTKGVASASNVPGGRSGAVSWTDSSGNLWLFGGYGHATGTGTGTLNDLWKWNGTSWTWMNGSSDLDQAGNYGTKGVTAASNLPGGRYYAASAMDSTGNLWLFGGSGKGSADTGNLSDLWKWDGTNWTWMSGPSTVYNNGTYGTKGVASSANNPGARYSAVSWADRAGNFWLLGGSGYAATGSGSLNDLWKWDGTNWTWVGGSNAAGQAGTYGTKGVASTSNAPGARYDALCWRDTVGRLWLFGGSGFGATDSIVGTLDDLWSFQPGRPVAGDFNGDGRVEFSVYRPSTGAWYTLSPSGSWAGTAWGIAGDVPVPADFDGDGVTNAAVFRPSTGVWYSRSSGGGYTATLWGTSSDIPVPGDFDGDGRADPAVFRPSTGTWFVSKSTGGTTWKNWGVSSDTPVSGDFDGDGKADYVVVRNSTGVLIWFVLKSGSGFASYDAVQWGVSGDVPVPADYDGDGKTDIAVFRPSTGSWYIKRSSDGTVTTRQWGVSGDIPQPADFDGDGKADIAIFRPGNGAWWVIRSSDGTVMSRNWGIPGDIPVTTPRY